MVFSLEHLSRSFVRSSVVSSSSFLFLFWACRHSRRTFCRCSIFFKQTRTVVSSSSSLLSLFFVLPWLNRVKPVAKKGFIFIYFKKKKDEKLYFVFFISVSVCVLKWLICIIISPFILPFRQQQQQQLTAQECLRMHEIALQCTAVLRKRRVWLAKCVFLVFLFFLLNAYTMELKCKSPFRSLSCSLTRNRLQLAAIPE